MKLSISLIFRAALCPVLAVGVASFAVANTEDATYPDDYSAVLDATAGDRMESNMLIHAAGENEYAVWATGGYGATLSGSGDVTLQSDNASTVKVTTGGKVDISSASGDIYLTNGSTGKAVSNELTDDAGGTVVLTANNVIVESNGTGITNVTGSTTVNGRLDVTSIYEGLVVHESSTMTLNGDAVVRSGGRGLRVTSNSTLYAYGDVELYSSSLRGDHQATFFSGGATTVTFEKNLLIDTTTGGLGATGLEGSSNVSITVKGDLTSRTNNSWALYMTGGASTTVQGKTRMTGAMNLATNGEAVFKDDAAVSNAGVIGARVVSGGKLTAEKNFSVRLDAASSSNYGLYVANAGSTATINGGTIATTGASRIAVYVEDGGALTGGSGKYAITGNLHAVSGGSINLSMDNGSYLNGSVNQANLAGVASNGIINLDLQGDSLWNVTASSSLTSLALGSGSAIAFDYNGGSFVDINTASVSLAAGSIIQLAGDSAAGLIGTTETLSFFSGAANGYTEGGSLLYVQDGGTWYSLDYDFDALAHTYTLTGTYTELPEEPGFRDAIPEPATATLGLLGLASLMLRRRRS